ncbi:universal stress protein [uncultured Desulfobacter sp.]|uniref:universal stress protein n=1 Tax=uncultured Desulfobacter sp. TaxID=240139 RepID=UPI0029F59EE3|nr:universal stress protein [uncultured Desulfobacter sp.]
MKQSILIAVNDSFSSKATLEYFSTLKFCPDSIDVTLIHVFRKPAAGDELMGKSFMEAQPERYLSILEKAKLGLVERTGIPKENIQVKIVNEPCETVADGIIEEFKKGGHSMIVIGRRKKSKAEEFVKGDLCIKLVRELEGAAILAVKTH